MNRANVLAALLLAALPATGAAAAVTVAFEHRLSDFTGPLAVSHPRLAYDAVHDEIYLDDGAVTRVYAPSGMESYQFEYGPEFGRVSATAILDGGDLALLSYLEGGTEHPYFLVRCNYRGEPEGRIAVTGLPAAHAGFRPDALFRRGDGLLLVSRQQLSAIETGTDGTFRRAHDLAAIVEPDPAKREGVEIGGFSVDLQDRMLFTVPVQFRAYVVGTDGAVRSFGRSGSAPGRFGVAWGIGADAAGRIYVSDKLRSVVMVFGPDFELLTEFGGYGEGESDTVRPGDLVVGRTGKVFVTQAGRQGVSVFAAAGE